MPGTVCVWLQEFYTHNNPGLEELHITFLLSFKIKKSGDRTKTAKKHLTVTLISVNLMGTDLAK